MAQKIAVMATEKQRAILEAIYQALSNEGYPPSVEELKERFHLASNQAILDHLSALERKRYIRREEKSARSIVLLPAAYQALGRPPLVPFLGASRAGAFTEALPLMGQWQSIGDNVARLQGEVFIIKTLGDSMINAGIADGDSLLVQAATEFSSGELVLAESANGTTIKRFVAQDKPPFVFLKPENPRYDIMLCTDDVHLTGKIVAKLSGNHWQPIDAKQQAFL